MVQDLAPPKEYYFRKWQCGINQFSIFLESYLSAMNDIRNTEELSDYKGNHNVMSKYKQKEHKEL